MPNFALSRNCSIVSISYSHFSTWSRPSARSLSLLHIRYSSSTCSPFAPSLLPAPPLALSPLPSSSGKPYFPTTTAGSEPGSGRRRTSFLCLLDALSGGCSAAGGLRGQQCVRYTPAQSALVPVDREGLQDVREAERASPTHVVVRPSRSGQLHPRRSRLGRRPLLALYIYSTCCQTTPKLTLLLLPNSQGRRLPLWHLEPSLQQAREGRRGAVRS